MGPWWAAKAVTMAMVMAKTITMNMSGGDSKTMLLLPVHHWRCVGGSVFRSPQSPNDEKPMLR